MGKLHFILGGCGSGKSTQLMNAVNSAIRPGITAAVLLPEQFSSEGEARGMGSLDSKRFGEVEFFSFTRLAQAVLTAANDPHTSSYASDQEKLLYLHQAAVECVQQETLECLGKRTASPEFIHTLLDLITKLRKAGVTGEALIEISACFPDRLRHKAKDIGVLLACYDRILRENGKNDALTNLTEAARCARASGFFKSRSFFIDEFDSFTDDQYDLLQVMLSDCPGVTVTLRADAPNSPESGVFKGGNQTRARLSEFAANLHIPHDSTYLPDYHQSIHADLASVAQDALRRHTHRAKYEGHVQIAAAQDPRTEVEFICAKICDLLSDEQNPLKLSDIAIAVKQPNIYYPLLSRAMTRYELPHHISEKKTAVNSELVRFALTVMEIACGSTWNTDTILRYAKSPCSSVKIDWAATLEHFCMTWSINGEEWEKPFYTKDSGGPDRTSGFGGENLEKQRRNLMEKLIKLRGECRRHSVGEVCTAVFRHLNGIRFYLGEYYAELSEERRSAFDTTWDIVCDIFETLARVGGNTPASLTQLREQFLLLVRTAEFSEPPLMIDTIRIVDAQTARLDSPKVLFIPGVLEGVLPGDIVPSGLFSPQDLGEFDKVDIHLARLLPELYSDELMITVRLLCAPSEQIWLTYPKYAEDGSGCVRSPLIDELIGMFPKNTGMLTDADQLPVTFFVRTYAAAYDTYVRHMHEDSADIASLKAILMEDEECRRKIERLQNRTMPGDVSPELMQGLLGETLTLSPSGIDTFYHCAFQYFCRYVLRLYIPEQKKLTASSTGSLAHYCLEQLLRETTQDDTFLTMSVPELQQHIRRYAEQYNRENFPSAVLSSNRFGLNLQTEKSNLLKLLCNMQSVMQREKFRPCGFEVAFAVKPEQDQLPAFRLDDGRVCCNGKIDRVDICREDGQNIMRVVDYKTGIKDFMPEKVYYGLDMQMLVYLFALKDCGAFDAADAAGVMYLPSGKLKEKQYEKREKAKDTGIDRLEQHYSGRGILLESAKRYIDPKLNAADVMHHKTNDILFSMNQEQMDHLETHVRGKITDMAQKLREGRISPAPLCLKEEVPCRYCDYKDLCGVKVTEDDEITIKDNAVLLSEVFGEEPETPNDQETEVN